MRMQFIRNVYRNVLPKSIRGPIRMWRLEREFHPDAEVEFYGAYDLMLRHLGEKRLPYLQRKRINWQHGWIPDYFHHGSNDPFDVVQNFTWSKPDYFNLVARKTQERRMQELGVTNSLAVGLPIVYFPQTMTAATNGALLIMPGHSLDYISQQTMEEEYVSYIDSIRHHFTAVTVCVHPSCARNGYWIDSFKKRGYSIVMGVEIDDSAAFEKLQRYFSDHEFCTTNKWGSHVVYAALFGCKVSIIGSEPMLSLEDFENSVHWANKDDKRQLHRHYEQLSNSVFGTYYPEFFVEHPGAAVRNVELARFECGYDNRINPSQYRQVAEWVARDSY